MAKQKTAPTTVARKYRFSAIAMAKGIQQIVKGGEKTPTTPAVYYTPKVKAEIDYLVAKCSQEVGFWGLVNNPSPNVYLIYKIYVPEQEVHATETDISEDAMVKLAEQIATEGEDLSHLYFWGHSHVNMGVSPSTQDEDQTDEYLQDGNVFIRGIYNKKGESKVDVFDMSTFLVHTKVDTHVATLSKADYDRLDKIIHENVIEAPTWTQYGGYGGYSGNKRGGNTVKKTTSAGKVKPLPKQQVAKALNKAFGGNNGKH